MACEQALCCNMAWLTLLQSIRLLLNTETRHTYHPPPDRFHVYAQRLRSEKGKTSGSKIRQLACAWLLLSYPHHLLWHATQASCVQLYASDIARLIPRVRVRIRNSSCGFRGTLVAPVDRSCAYNWYCSKFKKLLVRARQQDGFNRRPQTF
jgi:hypothetical protein